MNFLAWVENIFQITEKDVLAIIAKAKSDVAVAATDIDKSLRWIAANAPSIDAFIQEVVSTVQTAGILNPTVLEAIADANKAVAGLNVFAAQIKAGNSDVSAVIQGYTAAKNAQVAAANAAVAVAQATPVAATPAAAVTVTK